MKNLLYYTAVALAVVGFVWFNANNLSKAVNSAPSVTSAPSFSPDAVVRTNQTDLTVTGKGDTAIKKVHNIKPDAKRTLLLYGEVNESVSDLTETIKSLGASSSEPIYLLINSPGGSVLDGALVISAIESSKAPVYTVCMQLCASMAAMIHQYGKERLMNDRSILMFHNAAGSAQGYVPQMLSRLNIINRYVNKMDAYVAARAGLNLTEFAGRLGDEIWLDAEDATNAKFNDKIVNVVLPKANSSVIPSLSNKAKSNIDLNWE